MSQTGDVHPIDFRRLQVFVRSARLLSFAGAAQELSLTPSAVSHTIHALEQQLSCPLFQRHGPRVTITRAGIRLLPIAEDLLGRMERLRDEVSLMEEETRQLRVMLPEYLSASLLPRVLPDFFECFPSVHFELMVAEGVEEVGRALAERRVDLVLGLGEVPVGDVVRRDLFVQEFQLYAAPFHGLAKSQGIDPETLGRNALLVPQGGIAEALGLGSREELEKRRRIWELPSVESVRELARVGTGVAVLGASECLAAVDAGALVELKLVGPPLEVGCAAYWTAQLQPSWTAEAFLSFVETAGGES